MNGDYAIKGIERAFARLKRQKANQQTAKSVLTALQPVKQQAANPVDIKPEFNLEAYRLDIIARAIARIMNNKQKGMNK
ncbi:hypothetical protein [Pseudomonas donghuensis]|uniref:hypothetical protein n=1 Tax=Pseudomonas donghuensis TaxID=1163398 RepID=UPI002160C047|nr:hypothetical protein [Pseudomonas donghuensis]UVL30134.1 hypothetical protein LOY32_03210 [Pseudomonas donghuensis]